MKKTRLMVAMATVTAGAVLASANAHAQSTPLEVWQPPQHEQADPAKRVPATPQSAPTAHGNPQSTAPQSVVTQPQAYAAGPAPAYQERDRGGVFLGVQAGKGWVYEDVDQSAVMVNAGYRWQAGAVTLVGIEVARGQLDDADDQGVAVSAVDFTSVGANARFNFGTNNPVFGLVRAGYWLAEDDEFGDSVEGGYFGVGLGVDINRHFNLSAVYTSHVYFTDYGYYDDGFYYDANRADTLMLGAEVRF